LPKFIIELLICVDMCNSFGTELGYDDDE